MGGVHAPVGCLLLFPVLILLPHSFLHYSSSTVVILLYLLYPFLAQASCVEYLRFPWLIHPLLVYYLDYLPWFTLHHSFQ